MKEEILVCAVGNPDRICDACKMGWHDYCRGSCEDCGERYHSDPDDTWWLDRGITEDWTPVEVEALKVDGNR